MSKLPWFKYYPSDWHRDTRCLSLAARGAWADIMGILWDSKTRGMKEQDMEGWASEVGKPLAEVEAAIQEIKRRDVATVTFSNDNVTIMSRRQVREEKSRESTRSRVERYREKIGNASSNGLLTAEKSEVRSQKSEKKKRKRHAMSVDWSLSDTMKTYATEKGMSVQTMHHEFEHCKEHHADSLLTEKGWDGQVWRTWCLNWVSFGKKQVPVTTIGVVPKSFQKIETNQHAGQAMPDDVRALIAKAGKNMPH